MGLLKTLLWISIPVVLGPLYAFRLQRLPQHARLVGNSIGLFY